MILIFLIPIGLKLIHGFEYHSGPNLCENNKTHIHQSINHNDVLDYFFQPLVHTEADLFENRLLQDIEKEKKVYVSNYVIHFYKYTKSRAPPQLFLV